MDYHQPNFYKLNDDSTFLINQLKEHFSSNTTAFGSILDVCCGAGYLGLESARFFQKSHKVTFVEIQEEFIPYLKQNLKGIRNDIDIEIINNSYEKLNGIKYDLIVCNPPYFYPGESRISPNRNKAISRSFIHGDLEQLVEVIYQSLSYKGKAFVLIRRDLDIYGVILKKYEKHIIDIIDKKKVSLIILHNK